MKLVTVFLAGCLASAPLCALEQDGLVITLTPEEGAACEEGGGCLVIPQAVVEGFLMRKMQEAYAEGTKECNGRNQL